MRKLLLLPLLFMFAGVALGQGAPPCNNFDNVGVPVFAAGLPFPAPAPTPYNYNCTDYFGVGNWANSPMPSSPITGFTLIAGGSGYASPVVVISAPNDPTGSQADATASATAGVIMAVTVGTSGGSGYIIPQVSIVDVGAGGTLAAPTCGGVAQPACGSGAMATAVLGGPYTGGMLKFQDPFVDLKSLIAVADVATFPGSDYYEIAVVKYTQKMHASLPATTLLGYEQLPSGSVGCPAPILGPTYLGPTIVATKGRPVRVKFTNCLPVGAAGNLFIPTDTTYMGAGMGPDGTSYTQNRAELHLHGGATPWISDGTPHQWTVPVGETASLQKGLSVEYVPDMYFLASGAVVPQCSATVLTNCSGGTPAQFPAGATNNPGQGSLSYYWTNQQGARLMFYHDHAYGITRLNVYAGQAAGYLLADPVEENALAAATVPGTVGTTPDLAHLIPVVIQDKTFVPSAAQIAPQDPTWAANFGTTPSAANLGDLWFSHVYMTNQNPSDAVGGANGFGRWDYGAWFFPPMTSMTAAVPLTAVTIPCTSSAFPGQILAPTTACPSCGCPITPNPSGTPESFMDTPVVNGVAYPVLHVAPEAYRFRILSVGNDRSQNLSWFVADPTQLVNGIPTEVAMLPAVPPSTGSVLPLCGAINPVAVPSLVIGLATGLLDATGNPMNGTGLPANCWPNYGPQPGIPAPQTMWAADGRLGGAPDPRKAGPPWIQIGSEGGLLPAPVVIPATPIQYEQNTRSITITSVAVHGLWLGPAERADVIVDFSKAPALCAAQIPPVSPCTLILYNDAPTPAPAFDSRLDYFTGDGDQTPIGGAPNTPPGYGPNTRTIMQVVVDGTPSSPAQVPFNLSTLKAAFASTATTPGLFATTQPTTIVPEPFYNSAYNQTFPTTQMGIGVDNLTFTPIAPLVFDLPPCASTPPAQCAVLGQKAIQELFTLDYGRMNATMGTELPLTNFLVQTTLPYGYAEWPTELTQGGQTALWKVTHNGVDSHFIHFHLFNVQVVNRVGWDGSLRPIDANEAGWKETVRMNPLEDVLVALQPITPNLPFPIPDSIRPLDVTKPVPAPDADTLPTPPGGTMSGIDPNTGNAITPAGVGTTNEKVNLGWEYVWHCHILGHEENDMMRPIIHQVAPPVPTNMLAANPDPLNPSNVIVTWGDNSASETSFTVQRDTLSTFLPGDPGFTQFTVTGANSVGFSTLAFGTTITFNDVIPGVGSFYYRVKADDDFTPSSPLTGIFHPLPLSSAWSNIASLNAAPLVPVVTFTGAPASAAYNTTFTVTATTNSSSIPTIGAAGSCSVGTVSGTAASATALVTMTSGTGVCTLTANWVADPFFLPAGPLQQFTNATLAPLTITAKNATKAYGATVTFAGTEFTVTGLLGTDTVTSVTLTSAGAAATATVAGSPYPIVPSAAAGTGLANYAITYVNGTLTVTAAPLTITANSTSKTYGATVTFLGTEFIATGLLNGDTVTTVTLTSAGAAATATVALSPYPIVPSAPLGGTIVPINYTITYVNGTLTVNPKALTITANSIGKIYGQTVTFLGTEFIAAGLVNGNTVTSVTLTSAGAAAAATVAGSPYPIVPSAAVGTGLTNYTISYANGTLTVGQATTLTTLTSAPNPSIRGQIVTFSFSVAPQFTGVPSGSVTVAASTLETCSATLTLGAGSCTLTFLTGGPRTVTAAYAGDTNFLGSTSAAVNQAVSSVDLSTTALLFGNQMLFTTSASQAVTLTNVGTTPLAMNNITISGNFAQSNSCPLGGTLGVGRSCRINVTFTPTALGVLAGTLTITDVNTPGSQTVSLTGTGVDPAVVFTPPSLNFGTLPRGNSLTLPITLSNPGTAALTINRISLGGANPRQFTQTNNCGGSLAAGASCTINVTFSSSRLGRPATYNATLNVSDNAPGSPQTAALTATTQ